MIAKKRDGNIILVVYCSVFHELGVSSKSGFLDSYGRDWTQMVDSETDLSCFSCKTDQIFPGKPELEKKITYI